MSTQNKANIVAVMGGSGSGKSTYIKSEIDRIKPSRLVVFDVMHEYGPKVKTVIAGSTLELIRAMKAPTFSIAFQPDTAHRQAQFAFICKTVFRMKNVFFVVEELNTVTEPSYAPPDWQDCTSRGRHRGLQIYGASQRPAGVDKDFFSNATKVRTGRLNYKQDKLTLANVLDVHIDLITELKPLDYIERDDLGNIKRGRIGFKNGKPTEISIK